MYDTLIIGAGPAGTIAVCSPGNLKVAPSQKLEFWRTDEYN